MAVGCKKRVNRHAQFISIFYAFFIFMLCYATFFSSVSDADLRVMSEYGLTVIMSISVVDIVKEVLGAILKFRRK